MKNYLLIPALAITVVGASLFAASSRADEADTFPPNIQALVERFNLNKSEVTEVLANERATHQEVMQARFSERLSEAVSAGTLTEAQAELLLTKHEELEAAHIAEAQDRGNYSRDEWRAKMQERHAEMESWAETNGIDLTLFQPERGEMGQRGPGQFGQGMGYGR